MPRCSRRVRPFSLADFFFLFRLAMRIAYRERGGFWGPWRRDNGDLNFRFNFAGRQRLTSRPPTCTRNFDVRHRGLTRCTDRGRERLIFQLPSPPHHNPRRSLLPRVFLFLRERYQKQFVFSLNLNEALDFLRLQIGRETPGWEKRACLYSEPRNRDRGSKTRVPPESETRRWDRGFE